MDGTLRTPPHATRSHAINSGVTSTKAQSDQRRTWLVAGDRRSAELNWPNSRRRREGIQHQVDDDSRDAHVQPDGESPAHDFAVFGEAPLESEPQRTDHQWRSRGREDHVREEN